MQGGNELILIWLGVYVAGMAIWFFIAGWNYILEEVEAGLVVAAGILWPVVLFILCFIFLGSAAKELTRKEQ